MPTTKATKETAQALGVSVSTMRNWSDQYADFLSETARPGHLPERRFTDKDLTILAYIKQLRSEGMQAGQIIERLGETKFADTEIMPQQATTDASTDPAPTALQNTPAAQDSAQSALMVIKAITTLQRDMAALQASVDEVKRVPLPKQGEWFSGFGFGVVAALLLMVAIIGLAVLYGGVR